MWYTREEGSGTGADHWAACGSVGPTGLLPVLKPRTLVIPSLLLHESCLDLASVVSATYATAVAVCVLVNGLLLKQWKHTKYMNDVPFIASISRDLSVHARWGSATIGGLTDTNVPNSAVITFYLLRRWTLILNSVGMPETFWEVWTLLCSPLPWTHPAALRCCLQVRLLQLFVVWASL